MRLILHSFSLVWKHVDSGDNSWLVMLISLLFVIIYGLVHTRFFPPYVLRLREQVLNEGCLWSNTPTMDAFAPHRIIASLQQLISFVCE